MKTCAFPGCNAKPLKDDIYCFWHSQKPEIVRKRERARKIGGYNRQKHEPIDFEFKLEKIEDLVKFVEFLINLGLKRKIDTKLLNSLCLLVNTQRKLLEASDLEMRIERLESLLIQRKEV